MFQQTVGMRVREMWKYSSVILSRPLSSMRTVNLAISAITELLSEGVRVTVLITAYVLDRIWGIILLYYKILTSYNSHMH